MNKTILVTVIAAILAGIGLFLGGFFFSQANAQTTHPGWMMGGWDDQVGSGMMGNGQYSGMMGGQYGSGMMRNGQFGPGMMDNDRYMMGTMMNGGMMGSYSSLTDVDPLSIEDVATAVTDYLTTLDQDNLSLGEIMIFDNHAYVQIMDETAESGAFEVLVDPVTGNVFPEPGPNMMWNTEYGMMSGGNFGMSGGMMNNGRFDSGMMGEGQYRDMMGGSMMGGFGYAPDAEINISAEEAVDTAQEYLDAYLPGKTAEEHADAFPGYYTLHVLEDSETIGMLSVNAYTGQVFLHHWHGDFIETAAENHN